MLAFPLLMLLPCAHAASVTFTASGTVVAASGSSAAASATVTISTFQDLVQVQVVNNIVGASRDVQGISSIDFKLTTGQVVGTLSSQAGLVRTIASNGSWTAGDTNGGRGADFSASNYAGEWAMVSAAGQTSGLNGGITLTALTGGSPNLTIFGAANASNLYNSYGAPNSGVTGHNPYLASAGAPVTFLLAVPGVTVGTTLLSGNGNVRFFFGTDRSAFLDGTILNPEPASFALLGLGLVGLSAMSRWRAKR